MAEQFWMVWNPNRNPPAYRHTSQAAAEAEAERLARLNPGEHFIVLEAVSARVVDNMHRIDMRNGGMDDGIPF